MEEKTNGVLMDPTKAQAFIVQSILDDPALQQLAKQVVITALTRTLRRLEREPI